jgi:hypothetical protein
MEVDQDCGDIEVTGYLVNTGGRCQLGLSVILEKGFSEIKEK